MNVFKKNYLCTQLLEATSYRIGGARHCAALAAPVTQTSQIAQPPGYSRMGQAWLEPGARHVYRLLSTHVPLNSGGTEVLDL